MSSEGKEITLRWGERGNEHFNCILIVRSKKRGKPIFFSAPYGQISRTCLMILAMLRRVDFWTNSILVVTPISIRYENLVLLLKLNNKVLEENGRKNQTDFSAH